MFDAAVMFDAAIIGGGLAGCSAAITLAEYGFRVVVFDAKSFPHHKVCGEFLSPSSQLYLRSLGVWPAVQAINPASIRDVSVITRHGNCWHTALPGTGLGISRWTLDQILVQHAKCMGVTFLEKTSVSDVQGSLDTGFVLNARSLHGLQTFAARSVIAAYGKTSNLDRVFTRSTPTRRSEFIALKNHFYGSSLADSINLYTFPGGYCGLSAIEADRTNLCLLVRKDVFRQVSDGAVERFVAWMCTQNPTLGDWIRTAEQVYPRWMSISQFSFEPRSVIERDMLMAGDSAGLIAPLSGDGMEMALRGGRIAALAVHCFLTSHWSATELCQNYTQLWHRAFGTRFSLARLLQFVLLRSPLADAGLRLLNHLPTVGSFIVRQTRDTNPSLTLGV